MHVDRLAKRAILSKGHQRIICNVAPVKIDQFEILAAPRNSLYCPNCEFCAATEIDRSEKRTFLSESYQRIIREISATTKIDRFKILTVRGNGSYRFARDSLAETNVDLLEKSTTLGIRAAHASSVGYSHQPKSIDSRF